MIENISVYESLREHILHKEDEITNATIYMYVTYFALLAIGVIWDNWISLVSFVDLIVFQSMINSSQWSITKASIYIRIFFETKRNDIHWESLHTDAFYLSIYNNINQNLGSVIRKYGASLLATISFLTILLRILQASDYSFSMLSPNAAIQIVIALLLCTLTIYVNRLYFSVRDNSSIGYQQLTKVTNVFYKNELEKSKNDIDSSGPLN